MSGRRAFIELLLQEGVDRIFGNPGTTELALMDELSGREDMRYVLALHESIAVGMADGYAQASGRIGVVNLHAAPGLGNALGMLYDSQRSGTPLLITAGQQDQSFALTEPVLWGDLPVIARPFVKWSGEVRRFDELPRAVHRAIKVAMTPPTGPVFLSLPGDVLMEAGEIDLGRPTHIGGGLRGDLDEIEKAAALLAGARSPVLIAGDAVCRPDGTALLVELAERLGAPVYVEGAQNRMTFPASHPLFMGALGRLSPSILATMKQHDVLFSVGGDLFSLSLPSDVEPLPSTLKVIHLDDDAWEIGKNFPADVAILGNPAATLPEIIARLQRQTGEASSLRRSEVAAAAARLRGKLREEARADFDRVPIQAPALMELVSRVVGHEVTIVEETLSSRGRIREYLTNDRPQSFFSMRGGGIGWGVPATVGVKLAQPDRPVLGMIGDGSSLFTCQALWSAMHERLGGLVFLVINNGSYRILKQRSRDINGFSAQSGRYLAMDLQDPSIDYLALARTFGMEAERVTRLAELEKLLPERLNDSRPRLIEVMTDPGL